ncbi:MAG: YccF domain-containing protein [Chthoniobacteraceae bacterium]
MKLALNLLWFIFGGGIFAAALWIIAGGLLALTVVGLPFAVAAFRIAGFAAFPFGRRLVDAELVGEQTLPGTGLGNLLWVVLAGVWLAIAHVLAGLACLTSIVGIPFGLAHFKLASICFAPLGKRTVPSEVAEALERARADRIVGGNGR